MVKDVKEILELIEGCSKFGVSKIKLGELEISLSPMQTYVEGMTPVISADLVKKIESERKKGILQDELEIKEQQLQELLITDPLEYERQVNAGELVDDGSTTDEDADD